MQKMKSINLSSKTARGLLEHRKDSEFVRAYMAIDTLSSLYDSLSTLHSTPDPALTRESRAIRYRAQFKAAMEASKQAAIKAVDQLSNLESALVRQAEEKAGLHSHLPDSTAQEIRAAMRALSEKERNDVLKQAALSGDAAIIRAVKDAASPLLVGSYTVPMQSLVQTLIETTSPDLVQYREDITTAVDFINGAVNAFVKGAEEMRDPILEDRADRQAEITKQAEASLAAAMTAGGAQ